MKMFGRRRRSKEMLDDYVRLAEEFGWALVGVTAVEGVWPGLDLCYSAGLAKKGLPEVVMVGLEADTAGPVVNQLCVRLAEGERWEPGSELHDVLEGDVPVRIGLVSPHRIAELMGIAVAMSERSATEMSALQVIWPDANGNWPGDPLFPRGVEVTLDD